MDTLETLTIENYLSELASAKAVPGGGAAAALSAAQGVALLAMTLRVSDTGDPEVKKIIDSLSHWRAIFLTLASKDGHAFHAVMQAIKMPRESEAEKMARKSVLEERLKDACQPPQEVIKYAALAIQKTPDILPFAKASIISDAAIGMQLLDVAIKTAFYNVWINLKSIPDESFRNALLSEIFTLKQESCRLVEEGLQKIHSVLDIKHL